MGGDIHASWPYDADVDLTGTVSSPMQSFSHDQERTPVYTTGHGDKCSDPSTCGAKGMHLRPLAACNCSQLRAFPHRCSSSESLIVQVTIGRTCLGVCAPGGLRSPLS